MTSIIGYGAGSHARAVIEAIRSGYEYRVVAVADDDVVAPLTILGVPVVAPENLPTHEHAFVGVGGITDAAPRIRVFQLLSGLGYALPPIVHGSATVSPLAVVERGGQVLAAAIITSGAIIGEGAIINTGAIVEHDCVIGAHTHIAPGVTLGGNVTVGAASHVGLGATILQGVTIGDDALIAAGSVVLHDVPDRGWVCGVPAKAMR